MTPEETKRVIEAAGGDTKFAELLGLHQKAGYQQRVNNWKRRGMPADIVLQHYETVKQLQSRSQAGSQT